jgi:hypothetical protein
MPAALPGSTPVQNAANPSAGQFVLLDPLSGPKGSPFDAQKITGWANGLPTKASDPSNISTGALSTGIGFGANHVIGPTAPASIKASGFTDDYIPGGSSPTPVNATDARYTYIGGGRSNASGVATPYTAGYQIAGAGNGGSRDGGAGPAFTGFPAKMVTATGAVANGAAIETGFTNRSGVALASGQSAFGSSNAANAAAA